MEDGSCYKPPIRLLNFHCSPENCKAKPCLLVKKSVVNCKVIVLKVLWASGGNADPLSSLSRTPPSCGPSQIRSTSWTSSVWKTRKCRLKRGMNKIQQVSSMMQNWTVRIIEDVLIVSLMTMCNPNVHLYEFILNCTLKQAEFLQVDWESVESLENWCLQVLLIQSTWAWAV